MHACPHGMTTTYMRTQHIQAEDTQDYADEVMHMHAAHSCAYVQWSSIRSKRGEIISAVQCMASLRHKPSGEVRRKSIQMDACDLWGQPPR